MLGYRPVSWFFIGSSRNNIKALNSLWPSDTIWWYSSGSTLAQVMACCLMAPSHYLNQCWLLIREVLWHTHVKNFTLSAIMQSCPEPCRPFEWDTLETIKSIVILCLQCGVTPHHDPLSSPSWRGWSPQANSNVMAQAIILYNEWKLYLSNCHISSWAN